MTERLSPNDWAVLALVNEHSSHGWALAAKLARGGEIGTICAISRPIVMHRRGTAAASEAAQLAPRAERSRGTTHLVDDESLAYALPL